MPRFTLSPKPKFRSLVRRTLACCILPGALAHAGTVDATFTSATTIPVSAPGYTAGGNSVNLTLGFQPSAGTELTIVRNTEIGFISGTFSNLAQGQTVWLAFNGVTYKFAANYFGGTGNDLVLQWGYVEPVSWGRNQYGELGNGTRDNSSTPVAVDRTGVLRGRTVTAVSAGDFNSLALCSDGSVFTWGASQYDNGNLNIPVRMNQSGVLQDKTVIAISAGTSNSLALCSDGTVVSWGSGGELSLVSASGALAGKQAVAIAAGNSHNLALCSDGTVVSWGSNYSGQLGNGTTTESSVPVAVISQTGGLVGRSVQSIAVDDSRSLALCADGSIVTWGNGKSVPVLNTQTGPPNRIMVSANIESSHTMAIKSNGVLMGWGDNSYGQLGNGTTTSSTAPIQVLQTGVFSGKKVASVSAGYNHTVALCTDGTLVAWGMNLYGQLGTGGDSGNGPSTTTTLPTRVKTDGVLSGKKALAISTGNTHTLALVASSRVPDSSLARLSLSEGVLSPAFDPAKSAFTTTVPASLSAITVQAAPSDPFSTVTVNGQPVIPDSASQSIPLAGGFNTISVKVTTLDQASTTYTVNVFRPAPIHFTYSTAASRPVSIPSYDATGLTADLSLGFAPSPGTNLTVIDNTGREFITGKFTNIAQGQQVTLSYNGISYRFVANYYGGTGNDLVLLWQRRELFSWGYNYSGQLGNGRTGIDFLPLQIPLDQVLTGKTIRSVVAGGGHSLALCSDGTLAAWGRNDAGQLGSGNMKDNGHTVVISQTGALAGKTVVAVSAGSSHSLALCSDGSLAAWGENGYGQLGTGNNLDSSLPVSVIKSGALAGKTVTAISAAGDHCLVLCSDGTMVAWGDAYYGQLGHSVISPSSSSPVVVSRIGSQSAKTVVAISAAARHNLALCSDGTVLSWGNNEMGQLGDGSINGSLMLVAVSTSGALAGRTVTAISCGRFHNLVLCSDGTMAAWGLNDDGQLGNGTTQYSNLPVLVDRSGVLSGKTVTSLAPGYFHNLVTCSDGTVASWGLNEEGELGDGIPGASTLPVLVPQSGILAGRSVKSAAAGSGHCLVICTDNTVVAWGDNSEGQLGIGIIESSRVPLEVARDGVLSGKTIVSTAAGYSHSLALCSDGTVAAWGSNSTGQLGTGSYVDSNLPVEVGRNGALAGKTVIAVGAGIGHSLALCSDGTLVAWGWNNAGQLGIGSQTDSNLPAAVIRTGILAGKTVVSIAAGDYHNLALCSDGTIAAWGTDLFGGIGAGRNIRNVSVVVPAPVAVDQTGYLLGKSVVAVAAGGFHSVALCDDGTVSTWGLGNYGQLGTIPSQSATNLPSIVSRVGALANKTVASISAGFNHTVARCSDGTIAIWGGNTTGQLGFVSQVVNIALPSPVDPAGLLAGKSIIAVSTRSDHNLALCSDGTFAGWGYNRHGQLGNGTSANTTAPVSVDSTGALAGKTIVGISAGGSHSFGIAASPVSNNSALSGLVFENGGLSPSFRTDVTDYSVVTTGPLSSVRIIPTASDPFATVTVNGAPVASGTPSQTIPIIAGSNVLTIRVTAENGNSTTYQITLTQGGYDTWLSSYAGLSGLGVADDPDHDGIPNLLEYILHGDPSSPSPDCQPKTLVNAANFIFTFTRRVSSEGDAVLFFEYSPVPGEWSDIKLTGTTDPRVEFGPVNGNGGQTVTIAIPRGAHSSLFGRLKATR